MGRIRKNPIDVRREELDPVNRERLFNHYDSAIDQLDNRRIIQLPLLSDSATLADVISAFNSLVTHLNNSDLTAED